MSALAEALVAAQRRALQALEKAYVGKMIDRDELEARLALFAPADSYDTALLLNTLDVLREWGAPVQAELNGKPETDLASEKQKGLIRDLCQRKNQPEPEDFEHLTKKQASEAIDALDKGTYDPGKWKLPF